VAILVIALAAAASAAGAQEKSTFSLELQPQLSLPVGRDVGVFTLGGGGSLFARYVPPGLSFLGIQAGAGFGLVPVSVAPGKTISAATMNLLWPWAGVEFRYSPMPWLRLSAYASGGYYFANLNVAVLNDAGSNPVAAGGLGVDFQLSRTISIGVGAEYRDFLGLYNDIAFRIGTSYHFQPRQAQSSSRYRSYPDLLIEKISLDPTFPVLFKYYGEHPVGTVLVRNKGKIPVENLKVQFYVNQYMDNPTASVEVPFLKGGQELTLDVLALFNDKVLDITEATKVQANVTVLMSVAGDQYGDERIETLRMYDRNAITWADDRRVAAFVSAKDPDVMHFAKNVASAIKGKGPLVFNNAVLDAVAIHGALALYGVNYQVDPSTPYTEFSKDGTAIDYLQFPGQTLQFKAGDCDDLSILNASLLEALGIKTAFITVPGHIYMAFDSGMTPEEIRANEKNLSNYIVVDNTAWIPFEITLTGDDFLKAWETGAEEWRQAGASARLYPVHDSWTLYEPVGFAGGEKGITPPSDAQILDVFNRNIRHLVDRELEPQVAALRVRAQRAPTDPRILNSLGVLYARYGYTDEAATEFETILKQREYFSAIVNLANIRYMAGDMNAAHDLYLRAGKIRADSALDSLGLARTSFELADYRTANSYYDRLKTENAAMAARYSYLAAGSAAKAATRASGAEAARTLMLWSDQ
jgi:tetratricopeptide (TPR) repeat protein